MYLICLSCFKGWYQALQPTAWLHKVAEKVQSMARAVFLEEILTLTNKNCRMTHAFRFRKPWAPKFIYKRKGDICTNSRRTFSELPWLKYVSIICDCQDCEISNITSCCLLFRMPSLNEKDINKMKMPLTTKSKNRRQRQKLLNNGWHFNQHPSLLNHNPSSAQSTIFLENYLANQCKWVKKQYWNTSNNLRERTKKFRAGKIIRAWKYVGIVISNQTSTGTRTLLKIKSRMNSQKQWISTRFTHSNSSDAKVENAQNESKSRKHVESLTKTWQENVQLYSSSDESGVFTVAEASRSSIFHPYIFCATIIYFTSRLYRVVEKVMKEKSRTTKL